METKKDKVNKTVVKITPTIILTLIFIILKLTGVITWSWLWVLSPLWIPWVIAFVVMIGYLCFIFFMFILFLIINKIGRK